MSVNQSRVASLSCLLLLGLAACHSAGHDPAAGNGGAETGSGGTNSGWAERQSYLVLVSIDGFRWDYLERYPAPALNRLAARGLRARSLVPVYPTLTFPNHYSIATGLYPAHHGIVANNFPHDDGAGWYAYKDQAAVQDGRWYGGVPIWVAAERRGMVSAAYYFVGSEAAIGGVAPSRWHAFDGDVPGEARVDQVLAWLAEPATTRPHVVTLYFEEVDEMSHRYGPGSPESVAAIAQVDSHIARLMAGIETLPIRAGINVIVVSDHGQSTYRDDSVLVLDEVVDLAGFSVVDGGPYAFVFASDANAARLPAVRDRINAVWQHGHAYLKADAPAAWHVTGDSRFPALILQADPQYGVIKSAERAYIMTKGDHGWTPGFPDMHGIFIAAGGRLPAGRLVERIDAVDVYPLMLELLGLPPLPSDGDPDVLLPLLDPAAPP